MSGKVYVDGGLFIEVDSCHRVWLGVNDEYFFDERQLQMLFAAYLRLYPSKSEDIKTEYHNHKDGVCFPKISWLLR